MTPAELRAARKRLGLTQKGLAEALRMGTHGWQSISKWESDSNQRGVPGPVSVAIDYMLAGLPDAGPSEEPPDGLWPAVRQTQEPWTPAPEKRK